MLPKEVFGMPIYEYRCSNCGNIFEMMRPASEADSPARCPSCGKEESQRLVSAFASKTGAYIRPASNQVLREPARRE